MATDYNIKITANSKDAEASIDKLDKKGKQLESRYSTLSKVAGKVFTTRNILGATAAIAGLTAVVGSLVNTYKKQEQAEIRTRQTLKATGFAAGLTADELFKMAAGLQEVTTFGDETIIAGQNMLLTFRNIGEETFPRATEAMLDMSVAMGVGLKESAIQLGKALNDPILGISALTRVGITFTQVQKDAIKNMQEMGDTAGAQAIILAELENQFGGVARAARQGSGEMTAAGNAIGDVFEQLGRKSIPILSQIASGITKAAGNFAAWLKDSNDVAESSVELAKDLADVDEQINRINKSVSVGSFGERLKELKAERKQLQDEVFRAQKRELENTTAFKDKLAATNKVKADKEATRRLTEAEELDNKLYNIQVAGQERLKILAEERAANTTLFDDEILAAKIVALEEEQQLIADMKIAEQAAELSKKGQHEKALQLLEQNTTKARLAQLKLREKTDKQQIANLQGTLGIIGGLTASSNKALFNIGKAAALANHAVNVPTAISKALASAPPPFNFALAGLVGTAMAVQGAQIASQKAPAFADGGMVTGGIPGTDSVPATLMPGELVVPTKNFEEVVGAVQNQRAGDDGSEGSETEIILTMSDNVMDFIDAQVLERRSLGTSAI